MADVGWSRKWLSWITVLGVDAIFVFGGSCATAWWGSVPLFMLLTLMEYWRSCSCRLTPLWQS